MQTFGVTIRDGSGRGNYMTQEDAARAGNARLVRWLTCLMFFTFAMTTDAVGSVIPRLSRNTALSMTAAGAFQYATMAGIAAGRLLLGFLADRIGRKLTIILGLALYGTASLLVAISKPLRYSGCAAGGRGPRHQRVQDGRARADRRYHALEHRAHATHEQRRGFLRSGRDRGSGGGCRAGCARHVLEVAVPARGGDLLPGS